MDKKSVTLARVNATMPVIEIASIAQLNHLKNCQLMSFHQVSYFLDRPISVMSDFIVFTVIEGSMAEHNKP